MKLYLTKQFVSFLIFIVWCSLPSPFPSQLSVSQPVHPWLWPPAPGSIVDNTGCLKVNIRDWVIIARSAQQALCPTTCHILVGSEMLDVGSLVTAWLDQGMQGARPLVMPRSEVRMLHARPLVCNYKVTTV